MNPRVFTLEEANALIPKLEKLTEELIQKRNRMQQKHDQLLVLDLIAGDKIHDYSSKDGKEYLEKSAELEALVLSFEEDIMKVPTATIRATRRALVSFGEPIKVERTKDKKTGIHALTEQLEQSVQQLLDGISPPNSRS